MEAKIVIFSLNLEYSQITWDRFLLNPFLEAVKGTLRLLQRASELLMSQALTLAKLTRQVYLKWLAVIFWNLVPRFILKFHNDYVEILIHISLAKSTYRLFSGTSDKPSCSQLTIVFHHCVRGRWLFSWSWHANFERLIHVFTNTTPMSWSVTLNHLQKSFPQQSLSECQWENKLKNNQERLRPIC